MGKFRRPLPLSSNQSKFPALLILVCSAIGCTTSEISSRAEAPEVPAAWPGHPNVADETGATQATDATGATDTAQVRGAWLESLHDDVLVAFVEEALTENHELARLAEDVEQAREAARIAAAARWPALSANIDASRRDSGSAVSGSGFVQASGVLDSFGASLGIQWDVDFLLRLSDDARRASLALLARQAAFEWARLGLVGNVASAYYSHREAAQLARLSRQRLDNLSAILDIIESGYRQGINSAVDVYLSRSVRAQQEAQVAEQASTMTERTIRLQRLLGRVPDGMINEPRAVADLTVIDQAIAVGLPSALLARRQDLREAWFNLLSADAAVAVAHKNRFPRISLVANTSDTTREFDQLLSQGSLAWSLASSLTAPILDAGRLKAAEQTARSRARSAERLYIDRIAAAFAEVHQAIDRQASLNRRHDAYAASADSARAAADLALEQYQRGITDYVTVLESERRAFDAETTLVRLRAELLRNRLTLARALGGDWQADASGDTHSASGDTHSASGETQARGATRPSHPGTHTPHPGTHTVVASGTHTANMGTHTDSPRSNSPNSGTHTDSPRPGTLTESEDTHATP